MLYNFLGKADGASPQGPLVRDAAGNIFGSAAEKGAHNAGTIFKLAPDGTLTVLHSFTGARDGKTPQGGLLLDGAGNLFGSAFGGGDTGNGTLFQVSKNGGFRRLHSFSGAVDGTNPNGALIRDTNGNIFGAAQLGGMFSLGTVFKLTPAGQLIVLHNFTGDEDGATPFWRVARCCGESVWYGGAELPDRSTGRNGLQDHSVKDHRVTFASRPMDAAALAWPRLPFVFPRGRDVPATKAKRASLRMPAS